MSVIVFEHDEASLQMLREILTESGHPDAFLTTKLSHLRLALGLRSEEETVSTGPCVRAQVTVIILDLDVGDEVLDFLKQLKSDVRYRDTPVIVTSESDFNQRVQLAYAFGANDFLRKPILADEAKARIHSSLRLNHEIDRRKARESEITEIANQLRDLTQVLMKLSLIDALTGVANRRAFEQSLDQEFKRAKRSKKSLSVILFDVDHFKKYNDRYGHPAGDLCLKRLAQQVQSTIKRPGDMLARYGGEEFAIVLPETDLQGASIIAERVLKGVRDLGMSHEDNNHGQILTVSIGLVAYDCYEQGVDSAELIKRADKALYKAKSEGRNRITTLENHTISPFYIEAL
jgi:diguanylate cyclase (GGDEF)-like protein